MMIYTLLPIALVFSGYSISAFLNVSFAVFSIHSLTFIWGISYWLDNYFVTSLTDSESTTNWMTSSPIFGKAAAYEEVSTTIMNFIASMTYMVFPMVYMGIMGWAGVAAAKGIGYSFNSMGDSSNSAQQAGQKGGDFAKDVAVSRGKKAMSKKK